MKRKIICVFGTRPEFIKVAPVVKALREEALFDPVVVNTAQHRQLVDDVVDYFEIKPDIDLNIMSPNQTLPMLTSKLMDSLSDAFRSLTADAVLVQGDTTTAFVGALASFYQKIPVGHIEAGLRTNDIYSPFPEEINRRLIGNIAEWNFAPTKVSAENLIRENVSPEKVYVTGNTVIDTLLAESVSDQSRERNVLITVHRRENFGEPIVDICDSLKELALSYPAYCFFFPVHPNPNVKQVVFERLSQITNIKLLEPLPYPKFISLLKSCKIVISDSGGVQEEAPSLGIPLLVLRKTTERPEALDTPIVKLVGTNREMIISNFKSFIDDDKFYREVAVPNYVYGDGNASKQIVRILKNHFKS